MSDPEGRASPPTGGGPAREPYAKPAILWEEPLAVRPDIAMGCAKTPAEQGVCESGPSS